jgi:hypothetical protein
MLRRVFGIVVHNGNWQRELKASRDVGHGTDPARRPSHLW